MKNKILNYMRSKFYKPLSLIELGKVFGFQSTSPSFDNFVSYIKELEREKQIVKDKDNNYVLTNSDKNGMIGKISITKKGFAFIETEENKTYFVAERNVGKALDKDKVVFRIVKNTRRNRFSKSQEDNYEEAAVINILERDKNVFSAEFVEEGKFYKFVPDDSKINKDIYCEDIKDLVNGHKVLMKITNVNGNKIYASIEKIIGHKNDPGVDILSIIYNNGIRNVFDESVIKEVNSLKFDITDEERKSRVDLTKMNICTIDPWDAKDLDDAILVEKQGDNYRLIVSIADVSYYVREGGAIDQEAFWRGTSVYLTDRVIPMLPHRLSNDICSLNQGVERFTQTADMILDSNANVISYKVYPSIIKSVRRFAYDEVNELFSGGPHKVEKELVPMLNLGKELHLKIRNKMISRGYINFDIPESKIVVDKDGKAVDIKLRERGTAQMMIEDFMIAANECVARHVTAMTLPFIYRIHESPKAKKLNEYYRFADVVGISVSKRKEKILPTDVQQILKQISHLPASGILSSILLRCMQKAKYSEMNLGHFGLASKCYTHFTSPIRRYPDLIVHRLLREYCYKNNTSNKTINHYKGWIPQAAEQASQAELKSINTEYDVMGMKSAEYMEANVGKEFEGLISSVLGFGMFVQLKNTIEGLVLTNTLKDDYYVYNDKAMAYIGKKTGKRYTIGDRVIIKCVGANKEKSQIDFEIVKRLKHEDNSKK